MGQLRDPGQGLSGLMPTQGFEGGVDITPVELDPRASQLITDAATRASQSPEQIAAMRNAGVNQAGGQALQSDQSLQNQSAGMGQDDHMLRAIRNQYGHNAQEGINSIVQKNEINAPITKGAMLHHAAKMALAKQNVTNQNYQMLTDAYNQANAARAGVISNALSLGGTVGGMAMGSQSGGRRGGGGNMNNFNSGTDNTYESMAGEPTRNMDWYNA